MACCGQGDSNTKQVPAVVTELPPPTRATSWLWYTGDDYKVDIAGVPTKAKYRSQGGSGRAFRVFNEDVIYLNSLKSKSGEHLFMTSEQFNNKGATDEPIKKQTKPDYSKMRVAQLRKLLKERGSSTDGKKAALVERLNNA